MLGVAALLGLATLACGGDDDDDATNDDSSADDGSSGGGDRQKLIESLSGSASEGGDEEFSAEEIECMVPGMIDAIGVDKLVEAGALDNPEADFQQLGLDLTDDQANEVYEAMSDCVDLRESLVESMTADGSATAEQAQCYSDAIDDDLLRRLMVTAMVEGETALEGDQDLTTQLQAAAMTCLTPGG